MPSLDVERSDYMRTPGRLAVLTLGPLAVWMETADGLAFGFLWTIRRWSIGWRVESPDR